MQYSRHYIECRVTSEGLTRSHHFVKDTSKTPDVSTLIYLETTRLLGRHVLRRAENDAGTGINLSLRWRLWIRVRCQFTGREFGETKVKNLHDPIPAQHYVFWLDVAMNNTDTVSCAQCVCYLNTNV